MADIRSKKLFTPGPLNVSSRVKEAMLVDLGSRDEAFVSLVQSVRSMLLDICSVDSDEYTAVLVQGSGTYGVESVLSSTIPKDGRLLILENGSYGQRMVRMCEVLGIMHDVLSCPETESIDVNKVSEFLSKTKYYAVALVHCETSTGILNPLHAVGQLVKTHNVRYIVDAMSTLGAVDVDIKQCGIHYLISSANKCLQGVPGFSVVIAERSDLRGCKGRGRSLSLDLVEQLNGLETNGQFRFTPPTHSLLAFQQALLELQEEGGAVMRGRRYLENATALQEGMAKMGFQRLLDDDKSSYIITTYIYPKTKKFDFKEFYERLSRLDFLIYPGKVTKAECFRIGTIGDLHVEDVRDLLSAIEEVCRDMGIVIPVD